MKMPKFKVPENVKIFVQKQGDIAVQLDAYKNETGLTQKEFAKKIGMKESRLSKILAGNANLTLKSICDIEAVIGRKLIEVPLFQKESNEETIMIIKAVAVYPESYAAEEIKGQLIIPSSELSASVHKEEIVFNKIQSQWN